jgi:hypothetical protein
MSEENIYDIAATQKLEIDEGVFVIVKPYTDAHFSSDLTAYADKLNQALKSAKTQTEASAAEIKEALMFDVDVAKSLVETIEGFDLTDNWRDDISAEEYLDWFNTAHKFAVNEDKKKFSLSQNIVPTVCEFNGKLAYQFHTLRRKTIDDSSKYVLIQTNEYTSTPSKIIGKSATVEYKSQHQAKADLYDDMLESVKGFANDKVPMRVKILVIDYIFFTPKKKY